jgi:hypothetical protein
MTWLRELRILIIVSDIGRKQKRNKEKCNRVGEALSLQAVHLGGLSEKET